MAKLAASKYATALFSIAVDENKVEEMYGEVSYVKQACLADPELLSIIKHPQVVAEEKIALFNQIFTTISDELKELFKIIVRKNREDELILIYSYFLELADDYRGTAIATVESAVPLSDEQSKKIEETLSKNLNRQVVIQSIVDPTLIGGLKISVLGRIIDGTVKKQLNEMKQTIMNIQLA